LKQIIKKGGDEMPFVTMYLPEGCKDEALGKTMQEVTAAGENILENKLARIVRVTVLEASQNHIYQGGKPVSDLNPTVVFRIGPGRSDGAKDAFMYRVAEIIHSNLDCPMESIRGYLMDNEKGHHFCIGGKAKDFTKKVK
jgi:phenylpyruvate tautomerase PptA (4-oxalocrotonate tautomerase family)